MNHEILKTNGIKESLVSVDFHKFSKILLTEEMVLPEKNKYGYRFSKEGKMIRKRYYDESDLKKANEEFDISTSKTQNKRVFAVNFQGLASGVGKIKLGANKKGRVLKTGDYILIDDVKKVLTTLLKQPDSYLFDLQRDLFIDKATFYKEFNQFLKNSSSLCLKSGKMNSRTISIKGENMSLYEKNDELSFSSFTTPLVNGKYIHQKSFLSFIKRFTLMKMPVKCDYFAEKKPAFVIKAKLLPSVVVRGKSIFGSPFVPAKFSMLSLRQDCILKEREKKTYKKFKKKSVLLPVLFMSTLLSLLATNYQKPHVVTENISTFTKELDYQFLEMEDTFVYESDLEREKRILSSFKIGDTVTLKKGFSIYASSDYKYGGNNTCGVLKEDKFAHLDKIVILKDGKILLRETSHGENLYDILHSFSKQSNTQIKDLEAMLHCENGWVSLQDIFSSYVDEKQIVATTKTPVKKITSSQSNYSGTVSFLNQEISIFDKKIGDTFVTKDGTTYQIHDLEEKDVVSVKQMEKVVDGQWSWNLQNIAKKKDLLLEKLNLLKSRKQENKRILQK